MKIKLSKSQWEGIGKKAGWIKTAELSDIIVPVSQIIGTKPTGKTEDEIDRDMHSKGYFLFREHYRWGKTLSYRNKNNDRIYLVDGTWVDEDNLKRIMKETWRPAGREDQDWFVSNLGQ
jgi:hypothetical protein